MAKKAERWATTREEKQQWTMEKWKEYFSKQRRFIGIEDLSDYIGKFYPEKKPEYRALIVEGQTLLVIKQKFYDEIVPECKAIERVADKMKNAFL